MRTLLTCLALSVCANLLAKTPNRIEFVLTESPNTNGNTFNGNIIIHNNSSQAIPGGSSFIVKWKNLTGFTFGPTANQMQASSCDEWTISTPAWQNIAAGSQGTIACGGTYSGYFTLPGYAIDQNNDTVWTIANTSVPKTYNASPENYELLNPNFVSTPIPLEIGQATMHVWGSITDASIPQNKPMYAIAAAHAAGIVNNFTGFPIVNGNYYFSRALLHSKCGCAQDIQTKPSANPLIFEGTTAAAGCFQLLNSAWANMQMNYPTPYGTLNYNNTIPNDNFAKSCITSAYSDIFSLVLLEKTTCNRPLDFLKETKDPYFAEQLLSYAYLNGMLALTSKANGVLGANRAAYTNSQNVVDLANTNGHADFGGAVGNIRNQTMVLNNDANFAGGYSQNVQQTWIPGNVQFLGNYDEAISWQTVSAYIDSISSLFPNANITTVKANVQVAFNGINNGQNVNFSQLSPVIDELLKSLNSHGPDFGFANTYGGQACNTHSEARLTMCDLGSGNYELFADCYGNGPFNFTIKDENNTVVHQVVNSMVSRHSVQVKESGVDQYFRISDFSDPLGTRWLHPHYTVVKLEGNLITNTHQYAKTSFFNLFPNPAQNVLTVQLNGNYKNGRISIINAVGKVVHQENIRTQMNQMINIARLAKGMYFVNIVSNGKQAGTKRFIKK